jgi:DNA-binding transcriptional regulator YiaG
MTQNGFAVEGRPHEAEPLHYTQCGLPDVWLLNGFRRRATPYGDAVSVENIDGLHRTIALYLVQRKADLTGCQVRFLRKRLDKTQGELAALLRLDAQTVARWEKDQTTIPGPADLCLRLLVLEEETGDSAIGQLAEQIAALNSERASQLLFEETNEGWRAVA